MRGPAELILTSKFIEFDLAVMVVRIEKRPVNDINVQSVVCDSHHPSPSIPQHLIESLSTDDGQYMT